MPIASSEPRTLVVRLPNHLGDACMALPALDLLASRGHALVPCGRPWATDLLAAYPWTVLALPAARRDRVRVLRGARHARGNSPDALLFTNSFSSAAEFRLAGLRALGYARDGRSLLLARALPVPAAWRGDQHTIDYYLHLAAALDAAPVPADVDSVPRLRLAPAALHHAAQARRAAGAEERYVVLCPTAQGRHKGQDKCWNGFARLCARLQAAGEDVLVCPGPGELAAARAATPQARFIDPLDLGAFAALLAGSRLVVANDSGPGHLAAAVGARLIGVFGVTDPTKTCPRGATVQRLGGAEGWPSYETVEAAALAALAS